LVLAVLLFFAFASVDARASITVLVGEPFGSFGAMMPVGHTTIYLDRVCADGPLRIRMCQPGEAAGVALARYDHIGRVDWIASPILEFLYAVDRPADILAYATPEAVWELRETYRRSLLSEVFPDSVEKKTADSEWWETAGMAYTRRFWGYQLATTQAQDEQFVARMNARGNRHRYHLHKTNCADFAADAVNFYFPGVVHTDRLVDFGLTTPKNVARSVEAYGRAHPEAGLKVIEVAQVPGSIGRSKPLRGAAEMLLKSKRYVVPLALMQPEAVAGLLVIYLDRDRWSIGRGSEPAGPEFFDRRSEIVAQSPVRSATPPVTIR
jgi:hypothetical protein